MLAVLVVQLLFVGSYVGALHEPRGHRVPLAVVVPPRLGAGVAAQVRRMVDAGGEHALRAVPAGSQADALRRIRHRQVYGALVLTGAGPTTDLLLVASAAGAAVAVALPDALRPAEAAQHRTLVVRDVRPLPASDSRGLSGFYLVVGWCVGGYLVAAVLGIVGGMSARGRRATVARLGALAVYALGSGVLGALLVEPVMGVLHGPLPPLMALGALVVFAVAVLTTALEALAGVIGTGVAILLVVVLGNPSSGGPFAGELLPTLWRAVGSWLPPGAGTTAARNIVYFGSTSLGRPLLVLAAYALIGAGGMLLLARAPTLDADDRPQSALGTA